MIKVENIKEDFAKFKDEATKKDKQKIDEKKNIVKSFLESLKEDVKITDDLLISTIVLVKVNKIEELFKNDFEQLGFIVEGSITEEGVEKAKNYLKQEEIINRLKSMI